MNAVMTTPLAETITLYYREGSSDKVYQASIEPKGELFVVTFAYGRRGTTLNTGRKTSSPVDYTTAKNAFDKLVREKMAKGYTPGENGTLYQHTEKEQRATDILPQLLNPVDEREMQRLLDDPAFCAQEKFDGKRLLIRRQGDVIEGINRKGLIVGLPEPVLNAARGRDADMVLDGEAIGEVLYAFDVLELGGKDLRPQPYGIRLQVLASILENVKGGNIRFVPTARTRQEKRLLYEQLKKERKEGIVFKRLNSAYVPGRPNSGGSHLKHKFYATLSAVVSKLNAQRSVELRLLNCKGWVVVGNVTIPPNRNIPGIGDIVEIRYLYAFRESNCLYQPTFLNVRKDLEHHECVLSQLKYKAAGSEEE